MTGDLSGRTSRGAALTLCGNLVVKGLSIVVMIVVARVLSAEAYGVAVLALAFFGFAEVLTNPVLQTTLLREKNLSDELIDVAWTLSVLRGGALTILLFACAPWVARLYPEAGSDMVAYLRLLSLSFALGSVTNLHVVRLRQDMRFARAFLVESVAPFLSAGFVIVALLIDGSAVWIVTGPVIGALAGSLVSLVVVRPLPRLRFGKVERQRLWSFSRPLMLSAIMVFALVNFDDVFVATMAGTMAVGLYAMAFRWSNMGVQFAVHGLQNVLMPAYLKMAGDHARLRHAVISALSVLTTACAGLAALFLAFGDEFFAVLGGGAWDGAGSVARALVPFVLARGVNASIAPLFLVLGKPHYMTWTSAAHLVLFFPTMYAGFALGGVPGVACSVSVLAVGVALALGRLAARLVEVTPAMLLRATLPPIGIALLAAAAGWLAVRSIDGTTPRLLVGGATTAACFFVFFELHCRLGASRDMPQRSFLKLAGMLAR